MKSRLSTRLLFVLLFINIISNAQEREFGKTSLKYGVGVGDADNIRITGGGGLFFFGLNQQIGSKDRFRFSPQLSLGYFNSNWIDGVPDQAFYSVSLTPIFFVDALRYKAISLTAGGGVLVNNMRGLMSANRFAISPYYFSFWNYGVYLGGGLRITPPKSRIAIEVFPINFQFGNDRYFQSYLRLGLDVKLNK